jgi:hypothetical protein
VPAVRQRALHQGVPRRSIWTMKTLTLDPGADFRFFRADFKKN